MKYYLTNVSKILGISILFFIFFNACKKDDYIPIVNFNYYIDVNSVAYNSVKIPGNAVYLDAAGYKGVIIHCNYTNEYVAFERACPYHAETEGAVVNIDGGSTAKCPLCKSEFSLYDGSVLKGPAERPLKWYNTNLQGSILYVYN